MKLVILFICTLAVLFQYSDCQNWQDLSYSNIDIQSFNPDSFKPGVTPSTTTSTTPAPTSTTTKKSGGFFSGIKKIFGGGKKDEETTSTTATPTTTKRTTITTTVRSVVTSTARSAVSTSSSTTVQSRINDVTSPTTTRSAVTSPVTTPRSSLTQSSTPSTTTRRTTPTTRRTTPAVGLAVDEWPTLPPAGSDSNRGKQTTTHRPPSRSTTARTGGSTTKTPIVRSGAVTDQELATFSETVFNKDTNNVYQYITVNHQGRTQSSVTTDDAPNKLLSVNEQQAYAVPTISKMRLLFNNYELDTLVNEYVTPNEKKEENDFLDAVLATSVMRYAMSFLQQKGVADPDSAKHRDYLKTIWFNTYSRGQGKIGSSGFEHVFLTELKNGTLNGLHNWVYFNDEEQQGRLNYQGYMKKLPLGNKGEIIKLRMCRIDICKPTNSIFVGTSPELELALYTVCFALRPDENCPLTYNGKTFTVKTHTWRYRGKSMIGSAFVEI